MHASSDGEHLHTRIPSDNMQHTTSGFMGWVNKQPFATALVKRKAIQIGGAVPRGMWARLAAKPALQPPRRAGPEQWPPLRLAAQPGAPPTHAPDPLLRPQPAQ